jgi:PAS domain S-box-containing protein
VATRSTAPDASRQSSAASRERAKTEALLSSIGEGVIATDEYGKITHVNQAALNILGTRKKDILGEPFLEAITAIHEDGSLVERMDRPISKAIVSGSTITESSFYLNSQGKTVPVSITASPILFHNRPIGVIQVFRDISIELESDKVKTEFISVASHQLRTPLSAINLYSQMLNDGLSGELNDTQKTFLNAIIIASRRMNNLINTLLNITRIEAGSISVNTEPTNLTKLVREIMTEFAPEAAKKRMKLVKQVPPKEVTIKTDTFLVKEVFSNLLSNAIKYTPNRGTISLKLESTRDAIVFSITDTGYGIPTAAQPYIFKKFFRADNILGQDVSGTGLGLYLIKSIADRLQAELWFKSKENQGTTFYFSLPRHGSVKKSGRFRLES